MEDLTPCSAAIEIDRSGFRAQRHRNRKHPCLDDGAFLLEPHGLVEASAVVRHHRNVPILCNEKEIRVAAAGYVEPGHLGDATGQFDRLLAVAEQASVFQPALEQRPYPGPYLHPGGGGKIVDIAVKVGDDQVKPSVGKRNEPLGGCLPVDA